MRRLDVVSKPIRTIGYDQASRTLEVEFHNGRRYAYQGVTFTTHTKFINADSIGDFFHQNIKGKFKHKELGPLKVSKAKDEEPEL